MSKLKYTSRISMEMIVSIAVSSVATACQASQTFDFDVSHVKQYSETRRIRYGYAVKNTSNTARRGVTLWLPAPVRQTANQTCQNLTISRHSKLLTDEHGNQVFEVALDIVPPLGQVTISVEANLLMGDFAHARSADRANSAYTAPQRFIESKDSRIVTRAARFGGATDIDVGKHAFDWVCSHMQPTGRFRAPRGAAYALEYADGDCSEYAFLFTAFCRARAIPARCITGFVCRQNSRLVPAMRHGWAEFNDGKRWWIADCQLGVFAPERPVYLAMRVAVESERIPLAAQELSGISDPNLRVTMVR